MYKIYGRYANEENKTTSYYLVSNKGEKVKASVKYTTELASRGMISNAKVQIKRDGEILLRGNKINLHRVPSIKKEVEGLIVVGESKIIGKILKKNKIVGYVVESANKEISKLSYKKVISLASGNFIGNASLVRNKDGNIIIEVANNEELVEYFMDSENKIYKKDDYGVRFRADKQDNGGIIDGLPFNRGDWLLCSYYGAIKIIKGKDFDKEYTECEDVKTAICDLHIDDIKLNIERFDTSKEKVEPDSIKKWRIYMHK